ncbi:MAG: cohesin domain-containing protein [Christensenellaceae bacterium]
MKKILSFLLALALLIGIIPMSFAGAATLTDAVKSNYSIETTLSDGIIQKTAKRTFFVIAKDGDGNKVTPTATFNGDALSPTWDDATQTSFTLNFTVEGENTVVVSAGDAELTYTITYQPAEDGEYVGQAIFSIEAFSLGEGYIVEPVLTDIYAGDCAAAVLMRVLNRFGFTESHTGSVEGGFYLATIKDGTIPNIPVSPVNAPAELVDALSSWGITLEDRYSENELGEFDYCYASGWMYCLNNVFCRFSDSYLSDGDVVRVQFTVAYGSDIGGGYAMGGSDNTSFYPVANKDRLSTLIATLNEHGIEIPDSAMSAATAIYASQEDVNAAAAVLQQLEDEYQQNAPVRDVIAKISAIGEVSLESASAIAEARQAYDALTVEQQALVSNYDVLTAAEETLRILIEELPVSASFSAPEIIALSGQQVEIPVTVSGKFEAHTLEMHIGYDSTKLTVNEVVPGAILENTSMNVIDFTTTPGTIYVGALCADAPMTGNGIDENVLLTVKATVNPSSPAQLLSTR